MYTCFVDLEKAYELYPKRQAVSSTAEVSRERSAISCYQIVSQTVRSVPVNGMKTRSFRVSVGLRQGCVLSPVLFIIYIDMIDRKNFSSSAVTFGKCDVWRLLFAYDFALLSSTKVISIMHLIGFLMRASILE